MIKKLFIIPYFGEYPVWIDKYRDNIKSLEKYGYNFLFDTDIRGFSQRIMSLGIAPRVSEGTSLAHNYRSAYGVMYENEIKGYDFWGITDLDCVYGNVTHFIPDETLNNLDIHSNHHNYICGPWTLFRNVYNVNNLFREVPGWGDLMSNGQNPGRWTENEYTAAVDKQHNRGSIKRLYTHFQGIDPNDDSAVTYKDGSLYDHDKEIMMFHFNRKKRWPL